MNKSFRKLMLAAVVVLPLSGCSNDVALVTDLCMSQDNSYAYCTCYVDIVEASLSEKHLSMLAKMSKYQLTDGMDEETARAKLLDKHGRFNVTQFLNAFVSPKTEAELSCQQ
ncbi:MAG: hypothetical protein E2O92_03845 [Alphaproteobacteria bacterium]|nr:MAG: hypothetical protein E2O92_03845 [Alphaproteobacteria bacterium]